MGRKLKTNKKISLKPENDTWYGFDTEKVNKMFEGGLTYCNTFCVKGEYNPVAVYKVDNPNREKGHKDYLLIQTQTNPITNKRSGLIRGMNKDEILPWQLQDGMRCLKCEDVIFSTNRHCMTYCQCKSVAIDGGREYTKMVGNPEDYELVVIDLLKHEISSKPLG